MTSEMGSASNHTIQQFDVGIVGLGYFGRLIAAVLAGMRDVRIVSACDLSAERLASVAAEFGVSNTYVDFERMVENHKLDAVFVVTPENAHVGVVLKGLASGAHVFVEKPLALSLDDTRLIEAAARGADRLVMVGHLLRFDPRLIDLKNRLDAGELGEPVSLYARRSVTRRVFENYQRCHPWLMLAIHDIDTALWFLEDLPETIYAVKRSVWGKEVADSHWALVRMHKGAVVVIESTSCVPSTAPNSLEVYTRLVGTRGSGTIDCGRGGYLVEAEGHTAAPIVDYNLELPDKHVFGALNSEIGYFLDRIATGAPIERGTIRQAQLTLAVATIAIESEEKGEEIKFDVERMLPELRSA